GHSYSIKFHNVNMNISQEKQNGEDTVEGLGRYEYSWIRIDNGNWDKAFNQFGKPLAFELGQTVFGKTPYIGNHMHKAMAGQTMSDAFDAVIYIKPLEKTQFSASFDFIYTTEFKNELKRRLAVIHGDGLDAFLKQRNVTLDDYIDQLAKPSGRPRNPLIPAAE
ncbi:MAG: hypothetical protein KDD94_01095, partial [Calditrichaeota bacterium]|nr:hypothetical protein [Calditrichota bacterium]